MALELLKYGPMGLEDFMEAFQAGAQIGITKSHKERKALVEEGYIETLRDPVDGRKTLVRRVE